MTLPKYFTENETPQNKAAAHEKRTAREMKGRVTFNSGSLHFDKADVCIKGRKRQGVKNLRMELKRTDKESIVLKNEWFDKLERETAVDESWALELEIKKRQVVILSKENFKFYEWFLMKTNQEIIEGLQGEGE